MITETAKALYSGSKKAMELMNQSNVLDKEETIVELRKIILKMNEDALINKENQLLSAEEMQELKKIIKIKNEMVFEKGVFWGIDGSGPYCPTCLQNPPHIQAHLKQNNPKEEESWVCTACSKPHISPEGEKRIHAAIQQTKFDYLRRL